MSHRSIRSLVALSAGLVVTGLVAPGASSAAAHHPAKASHARPTAGKWTTCGTCATYYAVGSFQVTKGAKKVTHIKFTPNDGVQYCTPGKYTVLGSFKIRKGGLKGTKYHIGHKTSGAYQLNVAYKIGKKKQPTKTSLEIDFHSAKRAHVEFGPYGTASCNMFWDMTPKK